jgi:hypothetical protein
MGLPDFQTMMRPILVSLSTGDALFPNIGTWVAVGKIYPYQPSNRHV